MGNHLFSAFNMNMLTVTRCQHVIHFLNTFDWGVASDACAMIITASPFKKIPAPIYEHFISLENHFATVFTKPVLFQVTTNGFM